MEEEWICEICGQKFTVEVDLLAHQFGSQCERDLMEQEADIENDDLPDEDVEGAEEWDNDPGVDEDDWHQATANYH